MLSSVPDGLGLRVHAHFKPGHRLGPSVKKGPIALVEWQRKVFVDPSGQGSKCGAPATADSRDCANNGPKRGKLPSTTFTATKGELKPEKQGEEVSPAEFRLSKSLRSAKAALHRTGASLSQVLCYTSDNARHIA